MRTYTAGADGDASRDPDSREWVFGLLESPRYRERVQQLESLDLRRRMGCEPCLRALVLDKWTPETLHHLGWCDSCRAATIALGMHAPAAAASWYRRRAAWLAVAAFAVVAVPLVGSQVIDRGSQVDVRGGGAIVVSAVPTTTPATTTPVTTTPASTTPVITATTTTGPPTTTITPVPRSKPAKAVKHARSGAKKPLPLTT